MPSSFRRWSLESRPMVLVKKLFANLICDAMREFLDLLNTFINRILFPEKFNKQF